MALAAAPPFPPPLPPPLSSKCPTWQTWKRKEEEEEEEEESGVGWLVGGACHSWWRTDLTLSSSSFARGQRGKKKEILVCHSLHFFPLILFPLSLKGRNEEDRSISHGSGNVQREVVGSEGLAQLLSCTS